MLVISFPMMQQHAAQYSTSAVAASSRSGAGAGGGSQKTETKNTDKMENPANFLNTIYYVQLFSLIL